MLISVQTIAWSHYQLHSYEQENIMTNTQRFQFITLNDNPRLTSKSCPGSSTVIRMQAMRDFVRKQSLTHNASDESTRMSNTSVLQMNGLKGRFRLNSRPSKGTLAIHKKKANANPAAVESTARLATEECMMTNTSTRTALNPTTWLDGVFDPFDSYELGLEQKSLTLVNYCESLKLAFILASLLTNLSNAFVVRFARVQIELMCTQRSTI